MKCLLNYLAQTLALVVVLGMPLKLLQAKTILIPRSTGAYTYRELVGLQRRYFHCYDKNNYAVIGTAIEYTHSFDTDCIAQKLFGSNRLTFTGSQFPNRAENALVADYFGLPTDFNATVDIQPRIENVIIDLTFYFGLDTWHPGLYMRINAPITHTRWTLGLDTCLPCEDHFRGCTEFPICYMTSGENIPTRPGCPVPEKRPRRAPSCPINTTLNPPRFLRNTNCTTQSIREALSGNFTFGDMTEPWQFGRFSFCPRSKTGLADIDVILGWNMLQNDYAHSSFYGIVTIPTGNRPKGKYIFEPLVGDGKHWKLGGGFNGHISLYNDIEETAFNTGIYLEAQLVNAFKTDQIRSFDFKNNGLLSRYILLKEFNTASDYNGTMINAINFATRNCEVSVGMQADITLKAYISSYGLEVDFGYNFFLRDRETICLKTKCPCPLDSRILGIKGLEGVCCQQYNLEGNEVLPPANGEAPEKIALPTTQASASMFNPELPKSVLVTNNFDSICLSWNSDEITAPIPVTQLRRPKFILADPTADPELVSCANLDINSAAQGRMQTHTVFAHLGYTFEKSYYSPHIGIGAKGEFDGHNHNALPQWGIWLKLGATF